MTAAVPESLASQIRAVRRFAALSGPFDPQEALHVVPGLAPGDADADIVVALASDLAAACDTHAGRGGGTWLMRGSERRSELEALSLEESLADLVDWRRGVVAVMGETRDLLDALVGEGPFRAETLRGLLAGDGPRRLLERAAVALERAGRLAPAWEVLDELRAALTRRDNRARGEVLLANGFLGRESELAGLAQWLETPAMTSPVTVLFVGGMPGVGKSTLLEEATRRAADRQWIVVRLDFDRAGLDVQDWVGLTVEFARQVAAEIGQDAHTLRQARLEASTADSVKGEARERVPAALALELAAHVHAVDRPILLILDTLEVLRGRGETHPGRLFNWLDQLVDAGVAPLAVLAAGRGDALDSASRRIGWRIDLAGLDPNSTDAVMARLDVRPSNFDAVRDVAEGNPLVLRLAAAVAHQAGPTQLRKVVKRKDLAAAYLYRFLLSRIGDPTLKDLANPGLIVRRISPEVIAEVLGPQLGHEHIEPDHAVALFGALAEQHWLVQPDPQAPGFVTYRPDMRRVLVRLLYESSPARCARIDRAAAAWFARRTEPWSEVEAAYHRLQLMRRDPALPPLDPGVLRRFDDETISELPDVAQDVVRRVRGERSSLARGDVPAADVDPEAATREFEAIIGRGDWTEGRHFYDQVFRDVLFDAGSRTADVVRALLWRSGDWQQAKRLLDERDRPHRDDHDVAGLPPVLAAPRIEMRAELSSRRLVRLLTADPDLRRLIASAAGHCLRSELSDGALGFVLERAGLERAVSSARGYDAVGAVVATWGSQVVPGSAEREFGVAAERLGRRLGQQLPRPRQDDGMAAGPLGARLLAVLAPYADVAVAASRVRDDPAIARHAEAVNRGIALLGGLPPQGTGPWTVTAAYSEAIDGLAALGLLGEWLGAAAFVLGHRDLALIARSAERWRRTAAGQWSYGPIPAAWQRWQRPLDVTVGDRLDQLLAADDPVGASRRQLAAWCGSESGDAASLLAGMRRRLSGSLEEARKAVPDGTPAAAHALLRLWVPSAFVPPLAVLISNRQI